MYWYDMFDETIREGIFALLILQVLSEGDKARIELHREIGVRTDGVFCKTSSVLLMIQELLHKNLISSCVTPTDEMHGRTIYHIEDAGKEYLAFGRFHLRRIADTLRLFFGWEAPSEEHNAGSAETEKQPTDEKSPLEIL